MQSVGLFGNFNRHEVDLSFRDGSSHSAPRCYPLPMLLASWRCTRETLGLYQTQLWLEPVKQFRGMRMHTKLLGTSFVHL